MTASSLYRWLVLLFCACIVFACKTSNRRRFPESYFHRESPVIRLNERISIFNAEEHLTLELLGVKRQERKNSVTYRLKWWFKYQDLQKNTEEEGEKTGFVRLKVLNTNRDGIPITFNTLDGSYHLKCGNIFFEWWQKNTKSVFLKVPKKYKYQLASKDTKSR